MRYVVTINTPGYLPTDDDPPVFDTTSEAWTYLADERARALDDHGLDEDEGVAGMRDKAHTPSEFEFTFYLSTPGYDGDHDLGLAYTVSEVES